MSIPNGYGPFELESALSRLPWIGIGLLRLTDYFIAALNKFGPFKGVWTKAALNAPIDIPYNNESGHVQFFSFRRIEALLRTANFRVVKAVNLSLFSGPFSNYLCGSWPRFCRWNSRIADKAPRIAASAWFFECEPSSRDKPGLGETEQSGRRLDDQVSPVGDAQRASVAAIVTRNGLARLSGA